ncbi:late endosomal/lysosomal adaptor, MAPK and MTOR activator 5 [Oratosquilla oratoria]|uniref:late endosomal/lysosomal adaptor, MAPK and MTOR activator 5 n=1 Tax=Oratosquilla oratoria TaxID=337810 RepID=UPI003F772923
MEKPLEKCLDEVSHGPGVSGVLCTDNQGLCLGVRGKANCSASGVAAAIADKASKLEPESTIQPVIVLENDSSQCLIHRSSNLTLVVYKSADAS